MPRSLQLMADEAAGRAAEGAPTAGSAANAAARLCSDWCFIVKTLQPLLPAASTMEAGAAAAGATAAPNGLTLAAVPGWCAAAGAMLRALPQAAAIYPLVERALMSADEDWEEAPDDLADLLLGVAKRIAAACRHSAQGSEAGSSSADAATAQAAATAVWQLHTDRKSVV